MIKKIGRSALILLFCFLFTTPAVAADVSSLIFTPPAKTTYEQGEALDMKGATVTAVLSDGTKEDVTATASITPSSGSILNNVGKTMITAAYKGKSVQIPVTVNEKAKSVDSFWTGGTAGIIILLIVGVLLMLGSYKKRFDNVSKK